eukprot:1633452-Amphidinium_carterae.1
MLRVLLSSHRAAQTSQACTISRPLIGYNGRGRAVQTLLQLALYSESQDKRLALAPFLTRWKLPRHTTARRMNLECWLMSFGQTILT